MCRHYLYLCDYLMYHLQLTDGGDNVGTLEEFEDFKQKYEKVYSSAEGILCSALFLSIRVNLCLQLSIVN